MITLFPYTLITNSIGRTS